MDHRPTDWKQLGLLAGRLVTKNQKSDEAIISSMLVSGDQCLKELINEGKLPSASCGMLSHTNM